MTDYELIISRAEELAKDSLWDITLYANISALIYDSFEDLNWLEKVYAEQLWREVR